MKILVTGGYGQLGRALERELAGDPGIEAIYTDYDTLDITDAEAVRHFLEEQPVDVIVNCAAYTAVDKAESEEEKARQINTLAPGILGKAAQRIGAKVIQISTDYVFGGDNYRPYTEYDEPAPNSVYGRTKLAGESLLKSASHSAVIIRTAWLYSEDGNNFVKTMLRLAGERDELRVVADQIGTPTYAGDLAVAIHAILNAPEWTPGVYHYTDEGVASWYDFAKTIMQMAGKDIKVVPLDTKDYPTAAQRPAYSVLSKNKIKKTYGITIPYWQDSLRKCVAALVK